MPGGRPHRLTPSTHRSPRDRGSGWRAAYVRLTAGRRRRTAALLAAALTVTLATGALPASSTEGPAAADRTEPLAGGGVETDLDALIEALRDELGESSEAMIRAGASLRLAEAALPGAQASAEEARRLLVEAQRRQAEAAQLRARAQVQFMLSTQDAEQSATALAAQQAEIGRLAREAYQGSGPFTEVSVLLEARSPADFAERLISLQTLASSQRHVLTDLQQVQATVDSRTSNLEQVRDAFAAADERAQQELAQVRTLEARARAAEETVARLIADRKAALAAAQAAQAADDAAEARRETISGALAADLEARARAEAGKGGARDGSAVPGRAGTLSWPVSGRLTSPFGMRVHPITRVYKLHTGQDIGAACGTPIRAARDGVVIDSGWNSAYGWRTVVSHGNVGGVLLTTTYNHQQQTGVDVGQRVTTGQVIGTVGSTGYSTGCHLHLELFVNASVVDPVPWL